MIEIRTKTAIVLIALALVGCDQAATPPVVPIPRGTVDSFYRVVEIEGHECVLAPGYSYPRHTASCPKCLAATTQPIHPERE